MNDRDKLNAIMQEFGYDKEEAYFFLIDAGEWEGDGSADKLFIPEFLETYPA